MVLMGVEGNDSKERGDRVQTEWSQTRFEEYIVPDAWEGSGITGRMR
jgi:hypothetical protein